MSTDIYFAGESVRLTVDEDPTEVTQAFVSAEGRPLRLTGPGGEVYINPATMAFWSAGEANPQPETRKSRQPTAMRAPVTDIWGNPLGKKRRR